MGLIKRASGLAAILGFNISRTSPNRLNLPPEATDEDRRRIRALRPYTMTSDQRLYSLMNAVRYVISSGVGGDIVECGVWRGGSVMAIAQTLQELGSNDRSIWLYDTFQGMTPPTDQDIETSSGRKAEVIMANTGVGDGRNVWAHASRNDVEANLRTTGYPWEKFKFVQGDVAQTLHSHRPNSISLLRLDTDWYESTRLELETLFPLLVPGGVCILDDYGHWTGARQAVDEFFQNNPPKPYMHVIDYGGRVFIKSCGLPR